MCLVILVWVLSVQIREKSNILSALAVVTAATVSTEHPFISAIFAAIRGMLALSLRRPLYGTGDR